MENRVSTPEDILPPGDDYALVVNPFTGLQGKARKGTVAATLNNLASLEKWLGEQGDLEQIDLLSQEMTKLLSSLKVVGIFDLFSLEEWVRDHQRLARIYLVALYLKSYPDEMTGPLAAELMEIKKTTSSAPLKLILEEVAL